jgi:hypothetical protein
LPDAFFASTSWGNRSCIVFQRTVFTVQDLLLLQFAQYNKVNVKKLSNHFKIPHN